MTKNELLLRVAIKTVTWGDGSEFKIREVLWEDEIREGTKEHYNFDIKEENQKLRDNEGENTTAEEYRQLEREYRNRRNRVCDYLQKDAANLLRALADRELHSV